MCSSNSNWQERKQFCLLAKVSASILPHVFFMPLVLIRSLKQCSQSHNILLSGFIIWATWVPKKAMEKLQKLRSTLKFYTKIYDYFLGRKYYFVIFWKVNINFQGLITNISHLSRDAYRFFPIPILFVLCC